MNSQIIKCTRRAASAHAVAATPTARRSPSPPWTGGASRACGTGTRRPTSPSTSTGRAPCEMYTGSSRLTSHTILTLRGLKFAFRHDQVASGSYCVEVKQLTSKSLIHLYLYADILILTKHRLILFFTIFVS